MTITPQNILRFIVGGVITAGILFLMWYFSSVVIYILVSAVLAIMGRPLVSWLSKQHIGKYKMPRPKLRLKSDPPPYLGDPPKQTPM